VKSGDTLSQIAQKHKVKEEKIISFNDIEDATEIKPGDNLIIPDGQKQQITFQKSPNISYTGFGSVTYGTITQGMRPGHNAIDIANNCGTPIYSGGAGTVTRTGYDPAMAGNYIWIDHGSFRALYAHLWRIDVSAGQRVSGGQQIGTMGNTGYTIGATGCHIHFETRGGYNPFSRMQPGQTMR
jgi:murein DD-endopeptidase MepM/ murein hydrolase activator NlpD